jgi:hypothetical protein
MKQCAHRFRKFKSPLKENCLLNPIFPDGISGCRVDSGHENAQTLQDLPHSIMRRWTIADVGIPEQVLQEKRILAQSLDGLANC